VNKKVDSTGVPQGSVLTPFCSRATSHLSAQLRRRSTPAFSNMRTTLKFTSL